MVPIWGAIFISSWQRKQRGLQFIWNTSDKSYSIQDEREDDYRFFLTYNQFTNMLQKVTRVPNKKASWIRLIVAYFFILCVMAAQVYYQLMIEGLQKIDKNGNPVSNKQLKDIAYTAIYATLVVIFGQIYKAMARKQTYMENYRYQKDFDDKLIARLFQFNFFNFYMPMILVAFYRRAYKNLFIMMMT